MAFSPHTIVSRTLISLLCFCRIIYADYGPFRDNGDFMNGKWGNFTTQKFVSDPNAEAPIANVIQQAEQGLSPSRYILWTPVGPHVRRNAPNIIDATTLSLVWAGPELREDAVASTVQVCNGSEYITIWAGSGDFSTAWTTRKQGKYLLVNSQYDVAYEVRARHNLTYADGHELFLTPNCTAIFPSYQSRHYDLAFQNITNATDGSKGFLMDSYFQEVDVVSGELLFEWRASDHIDPADSFWNATLAYEGMDIDHGYDFFHINSVEKDHMGNYLVNSRHMHAVYYISSTGEVLWTLGGKRNQYKDMSGGKATNMAWAHHARWVDDSLTKISLFDNQNAHKAEEPVLSRGIILRLDHERKEVWLDHEYPVLHNSTVIREGSMQIMHDADENAVIGYGFEPAWTEFARDGTVLQDVVYSPLGLDRGSPDNYRMLKVNWTGHPRWGPRIAPGPKPMWAFVKPTQTFEVELENAYDVHVNDTAYFSWNGATEVAAWVVLTSNSTANLTLDDYLVRVTKQGFEDSVFVGSGTRYVKALALDGEDSVIGKTGAIDMHNFTLADGYEDGDGWKADLDDLNLAWKDFDPAKIEKALHDRLLEQLNAAIADHPHATIGVMVGVSVSLLLSAGIMVGLMSRFIFGKRRQAYLALQPADGTEAGLTKETKSLLPEQSNKL